VRTVIYSNDNAALRTGVLLDVPLSFSQAVPEVERGLSLSNVLLSRRNGGSVDARLLPFGRIATPASGPVYPASLGGGLRISAVALDTDKNVSSVEFKVDGQTVGISTRAPFALHWTPTAEGNYVIAALVTDNDGNLRDLGSRSISVDLLSSYTEWSNTYFGANAVSATAGPMADPNGNGLVNLFEYSLGRNPSLHNPDGLPLPEIVKIDGEDYLMMTYRLPVGARGVNHRVEYSEDLMNWNSGPQYTVEEPPVIDGLMKTMRVRAATPAIKNGSQAKGFLRLIVTAE